jgi:hypothetical protein
VLHSYARLAGHSLGTRRKEMKIELLPRGNEERWCVAELLRIKSELILREGAPQGAAAAEQHFLRSLDWARRQGAL